MRFFFYTILLIIIFFAKSTNAQNVENIEIIGNKRISDETVLVLGSIDLNIFFDDQNLDIILKNLYSSNFFADVRLSFDNDTLKIELIENPIIENIEFTGFKNTDFINELKQRISLKERMSFTQNKLNQDLILIQNILKSSGYYFANTTSSLIKDEELNSIRLSININEGKKARIKNIVFIGDKKIKDKKLLEIIASEEHQFWKFISNKVYLNQSTINLDINLLENYYKNLGYFKVKVINNFAELTNNGDFNLIYNIEAGDKYYFNDFVLSLPEDYNSKDFNIIKETFNDLKGETFSLNKLNIILKDIDYVASSRMYDFIDVAVTENITDNKINFTFDIKDSNKFYVERVNIYGNYATIEEVIRNQLIVDEGDPLNNILFNKSINQIKSLGIFKTVNSEIINGKDENFKILNINVEEKPTGEISLGAGVGTSGSTIGGGIIERNFLGKGINLNTNLEISEESIRGKFVYSKPNFAYTDNTLSTSIQSVTTDNLSDFGYKVTTTGFDIGTEFQQFENLFFSPSLAVSIEDLETNNNASNNLKKQEGSYNDLYFNYGINYDLRDSTFNPTSGSTKSFFQELPMISDNNEISNTFLYSKYKNLNPASNMIGRLSLYAKAINSLDDEDVRISKRAQIPYNRLRGFEKGKVGPKDNSDYIGGNYVTAVNLSTNIPTFLDTIENIDFKYYIDMANVWGVDYDSSIDDSNFIRSSTGIGIDLLTPVGPLSFSFTQPITKKSSDKTETFRFNLGTTF
jgi:outer membrane protein insertion porin family